MGFLPRTKQKRITRTFGSLPDAQRWLLDNAQADAANGGESLARLLLRFQANLETGTLRDKHGRIYKPSTAKDYTASIDLLCVEYPEVLRRPVDVLLRSDLQQLIEVGTSICPGDFPHASNEALGIPAVPFPYKMTTICFVGPSAYAPIHSALTLFRSEFEARVTKRITIPVTAVGAAS